MNPSSSKKIKLQNLRKATYNIQPDNTACITMQRRQRVFPWWWASRSCAFDPAREPRKSSWTRVCPHVRTRRYFEGLRVYIFDLIESRLLWLYTVFTIALSRLIFSGNLIELMTRGWAAITGNSEGVASLREKYIILFLKFWVLYIICFSNYCCQLNDELYIYRNDFFFSA